MLAFFVTVSSLLFLSLADGLFAATGSCNSAAAASFYKKNGSLYQAGEILVQKDLAWTLKQLSEYGPDAFYEGAIAKKIVKEMERNGGLITAEDLKNYIVAELSLIHI